MSAEFAIKNLALREIKMIMNADTMKRGKQYLFIYLSWNSYRKFKCHDCGKTYYRKY